MASHLYHRANSILQHILTTDIPRQGELEISAVSATSDKKTREALDKLLQQNRNKFAIEYDGDLSNHLSHALIVLHELGASPAKLRQFYDFYTQRLRLETERSAGKVTAANWKEFLGQRKYYRDYVEFFQKEFNAKGEKTVVCEYFPQLVPGIIGAAFHGLNELGYALELESNEANASEGLAYFSFNYQLLGELTELKDCLRENPIEVLKRVEIDSEFNDCVPKSARSKMFEAKAHLVSDKISANGKSVLSKYDLFIDPKNRDEVTALLELFARAVAQAFVFTGCNDFFLLHGITGFHALRNVLRRIDDVAVISNALRHFWRALVCTFVVQGRPHIQSPEEFSRNFHVSTRLHTTSPSDAVKEALRTKDEHLLKLIFVCLTDYETYARDEVFLLAPRHAIELIHYEKGGHWRFGPKD